MTLPLPLCPRGQWTHAKLRVSISLTRRPASDGASPLPSPHLFCEAATFVVARSRVEIVPARLLARSLAWSTRTAAAATTSSNLAPLHPTGRLTTTGAARCVCRRWLPPSSFSPERRSSPPRSFFPFMVTTYKQRRLPSLTTNCCSHY